MHWAPSTCIRCTTDLHDTFLKKKKKKRYLPALLHGFQPSYLQLLHREQGDKYPHNREEQLIHHIKVLTA